MTTPENPLGDDEMSTEGVDPTGVAAGPGADADGTDGGDADGTDGGDADGTDADGTDGDATDTTDGDAS